MTKTMKTYTDKVTVWDCGDAVVTIECDDGCAKVEFKDRFWNSQGWQEVSDLVLKAIQLMETEQTELDQQSVA